MKATWVWLVAFAGLVLIAGEALDHANGLCYGRRTDSGNLIPGQEFNAELCVWQQKIADDVVVDPNGAKAIDHHASTEFLMALTEWCYPIYYIDGSDPSTYSLEDVYLTTDWHPAGHVFKNVPIPKGVELKPDATSDGYFGLHDLVSMSHRIFFRVQKRLHSLLLIWLEQFLPGKIDGSNACPAQNRINRKAQLYKNSHGNGDENKHQRRPQIWLH